MAQVGSKRCALFPYPLILLIKFPVWTKKYLWKLTFCSWFTEQWFSGWPLCRLCNSMPPYSKRCPSSSQDSHYFPIDLFSLFINFLIFLHLQSFTHIKQLSGNMLWCWKEEVFLKTMFSELAEPGFQGAKICIIAPLGHWGTEIVPIRVPYYGQCS